MREINRAVNGEERVKLTEGERWEWLRQHHSNRFVIPWDRMAIPMHEWFDKYTEIYNTGTPIVVPTYWDEMSRGEKKWIDGIFEEREERKYKKSAKAPKEVYSQFNYCIGKPWEEGSKHLSIYALGSQVHYGTMEQAEAMREGISKREGKEYEIYKLDNLPFRGISLDEWSEELDKIDIYEPLTEILNKGLMLVVNSERVGFRRKLVQLRKLLKAFEDRIDKYK